MHERRRLKRLAGLLLGQLRGGKLAQLVVDERQKLLSGVGIALLDGRQDAGNIAHACKYSCQDVGNHPDFAIVLVSS
jgi:hypothetical protein